MSDTTHNQKVLFLDIDGVLNATGPDDRGRIGTFFRRECIDALNLILAADFRIVLSSAWRYQIHNGQISRSGFEIMLHSHGACPIMHRIIGETCPDEQVRGRGLQIDRWIRSNGGDFRCVAVDDEDDGITACDLLLVKTDSTVGLTRENAIAVIAHLEENPPECRQCGGTTKEVYDDENQYCGDCGASWEAA